LQLSGQSGVSQTGCAHVKPFCALQLQMLQKILKTIFSKNQNHHDNIAANFDQTCR
jgi:hypothetical protein